MDDYLAASDLTFDEVWRKGGDFPTSGVSKRLGDRNALKLSEQEGIAEDFVSEHTVALRKLAEFPGVDAVILGLHYIVDQRGVVNVALGPSFRLMFECLRAGVRPVFYVDLERAVVGGEMPNPHRAITE